ncbi:hypothetical protein VP1G_02669 [Cytospora mali]|uniref:Uncharacterized protein n=1 Tax=Cytospora mali TaxID=578113 RepID=A0A194UUB5_CYTMA|nr:hypothetical protein VP1G_02669 [Valsa mali var. pyri (nom. inval.)]
MPFLGSDDEALVPVEMKGRERKRFYEPIVLLLALTKACMHNNAPKVLEQAPEIAFQTPEQLFHGFINVLAQICDTKRGGNTVTAIVVLQYPERVQYRLASNQRDEVELAQVESFLKDILNTLQAWTKEQTDIVKARILRKVVAFNRPRLQLYVRAIHTQSKICLEEQTSNVTAQTTEKIKNLRDLSAKADDRGLEEASFFENCEELMRFVKELSRSETYRILRDKATTANGQNSPWGELRHAAGRLQSYLQGVKTLVEARKYWDRLFHDFEIVCLPSSTAIPSPLPRNNLRAEDIIGRMTSDEAKGRSYKRSVQDLQIFGLDEDIQKQVKNKNFCTIVHAEALVHQSIISDDDLKSLHPTKFFDSYRYIGCSKPTCRLCHYYFLACGDGVQVRQTHRNLYPNWRVPDIYPDQGEKAVKRRVEILSKMNDPIRKDTFRTLDDKVGERRPHDSNTDPTYKHGTSVGYTDGWNEDIDEDVDGEAAEEASEAMGRLSVQDTEKG